jgi:integrase
MSHRKQPTRTRGVPYIDVEDNGYWYVYWSEGRRSKRQSLGTQSQTEATARFAQWLQQDLRSREGVAASAEYTVAEVWKAYDTKHVQTDAIVAAGRETIEQAWKNLEPHFGDVKVRDVSQAVVDDYVEKRRAGRIGHNRAAPATIRRELAYLLASFRFAASKKGGALIAVTDIDEIKLPAGSPPRDRWLKIDEMKRLLQAAADMRRGDRLSRGERFLWLGLETAARKEAIMDLTWDRVDFEAGVIHFDVPGRRQTSKRRAAVPISTSLRPVLERAFKEREGVLVMDNKAPIWATIQFIAIRAGFSEQTVKSGGKPKRTGISPHVLRHTAATHMARRGVPLWVIAQILGNTLAMVERVYAKWQPSDPAGTVDHISGGVLEIAE